MYKFMKVFNDISVKTTLSSLLILIISFLLALLCPIYSIKQVSAYILLYVLIITVTLELVIFIANTLYFIWTGKKINLED